MSIDIENFMYLFIFVVCIAIILGCIIAAVLIDKKEPKRPHNKEKR